MSKLRIPYVSGDAFQNHVLFSPEACHVEHINHDTYVATYIRMRELFSVAATQMERHDDSSWENLN